MGCFEADGQYESTWICKLTSLQPKASYIDNFHLLVWLAIFVFHDMVDFPRHALFQLHPQCMQLALRIVRIILQTSLMNLKQLP